jgi:hypothetical protein
MFPNKYTLYVYTGVLAFYAFYTFCAWEAYFWAFKYMNVYVHSHPRAVFRVLRLISIDNMGFFTQVGPKLSANYCKVRVQKHAFVDGNTA